MSGLCASLELVGGRADLSLLRVAAGAASDRGRDGIAYWIRDEVGLAHLALRATPEAENETQPALSDDRLLCLAADARIDHRQRLIEELREAGTLRAGHPTDAHLILAAYERWVEECPAHLMGDFAFALWDGRKQQLFCARGSNGVRGLHFLRLDDRLWAASDPSQLLALPGAPTSVDPWWVADYLGDLSIEPRRTPFTGVERLPPGHQLIAARGDFRVARTPDRGPSVAPEASPGEACDDEDGFLAACRTSLRSSSEVVGIALEAGPASARLDSTVRCIAGEPGSTLEVFTAAPPALDEVEVARGSHPSVPTLGTPSIDAPATGWETAERELMRRLADRGGRVLLTTQGATAPGVPGVASPPDWLGRDLAATTDFETRLRAAEGSKPRTLNSYTRALATDSLQRALAWQERIGLAYGIEVRHPYLDHRRSDWQLPHRDIGLQPMPISAAALSEARRDLGGELRISAQGLCRASSLDAAIQAAEQASARDRAQLWRALALEHWMRLFDLSVDL